MEAVELLLMNWGRDTKEETDSREKPDFLGSGDLAVSEFSRGPDWSQ